VIVRLRAGVTAEQVVSELSGISARYQSQMPRFYVDPATVPPEQAAQRVANMATMRVFAGDPYMHEPGLPGRLGRVEIPVLVLWGDSDRIVTPGYGQALAAAFPQAQFTVISQAGHLPQLEQPDATFGALDAFIRKDPGRPAA
jgi:pimeloyl-ACP methyl ester carboxylesterase